MDTLPSHTEILKGADLLQFLIDLAVLVDIDQTYRVQRTGYDFSLGMMRSVEFATAKADTFTP